MSWHGTKLSRERLAAVELLEKTTSREGAAKRLGTTTTTTTTTIDRILGAGRLTRATAERLGPRIDALGAVK